FAFGQKATTRVSLTFEPPAFAFSPIALPPVLRPPKVTLPGPFFDAAFFLPFAVTSNFLRPSDFAAALSSLSASLLPLRLTDLTIVSHRPPVVPTSALPTPSTASLRNV